MIRINDLHFQRREDSSPLLSGLTFEIKSGDCVGLTGESGIGKTTIAKLIAGHLQPTKGEISINGNRHLRPSRQIFLMNQADDLFPWQDVSTQIAFALSRPSEKKVQELIRLVRLEGAEKKFPKELSGGMKKRLSLARALAIEPSLLILDEAFSSLDIELKKSLHQDLRLCWEQIGMTILIITHDHSDIQSLANREIQLASTKPTRISEDLTL